MFAKVQIEKQGLGKVHFYRGIIKGSSPLYLRPNWHPMGTLRMGSDFRTSVCDKQLRFGGHKNIFMLNSGVFPTGSNCNPTYTVLALASYLAENFEKAQSI
jgi:choline dehydrogenase-like flavoprotein